MKLHLSECCIYESIKNRGISCPLTNISGKWNPESDLAVMRPDSRALPMMSFGMACPTLMGHGKGCGWCGWCGWVWMVCPSTSIASSDVSTQVVVPHTVHLSVAASAFSFYCVSWVGISNLPHCNSKISLKYQANPTKHSL